MLIRNHSWEVKRKYVSEHKAGREETPSFIVSVLEVMLFLPHLPDSKPTEAPWRGVCLMWGESELKKRFPSLADYHNHPECFLKGTDF